MTTGEFEEVCTIIKRFDHRGFTIDDMRVITDELIEEFEAHRDELVGKVTTINGYVTDSDKCYKRITYVRPIVQTYESYEGVKSHKYVCPVCRMLDNSHQVSHGDKNCALCNVNLYWD